MRLFPFLSLLSVLSISTAVSAQEQKPINSVQRQQALDMLKSVSKEIEKNYYDPGLHHSDFEKRLAEAPARIQQARTFGDCFTIIASVIDALDDSHTYFLPPSRSYRIERGWTAQYIGDRYFVTAVKPGSDADRQGLRPGDEIVNIENYRPDRKVQWKMDYYFNALAPRSGFHLAVLAPGQTQPRNLLVMSKVVQEFRTADLTGDGIWDFIRRDELSAELDRVRMAEKGNVLIAKIPTFAISPEQMLEVRSHMKNRDLVIFDLRGNGGGYEKTLTALLGTIFDHQVKVGDLVARKPEKPVVANPVSSPFGGKVVVLIDSDSGSAAELFARVVQLEGRGKVYGDRSSGMVMRGQVTWLQEGVDTVIPYGVQVTRADLIMKDGKSLERVGVTPDKVMLPTAEDLAAQRDPVLAAAAAEFGIQLSAEQAGHLFPHKWAMQ